MPGGNEHFSGEISPLIKVMNQPMQSIRLLTLSAAVIFLLTGCISGRKEYKSADFTGEKLYTKSGATGPQLIENEVLGLQEKAPSDQQIASILEATRDFSVKPQGGLLLVQSGSSFPDGKMQEELAKDFRVIAHSGLAREIRSDESIPLASALRMAAARAGAETILVYWGNLEMRRQELGTDLVSWLPVLDITVPDEYHKLRLSLRVALVDVRTGKWTTYNVEPFETEALSTRFAREKQEPVPLNNLKTKAYAAAANHLRKNYLRM